MAKPIDDTLTMMVTDALVDIGVVAARRMFGGIGIFCDDKMFGIVFDDTLYFKVDDSSVGEYEAAGSEQFTPHVRGRTMSMPYYTLPAEVVDNPDMLFEWGERSIQVARASKKKK